jgi:Sulfate permease family
MQNLPSPETQADNFEDTMPIYPTSSTVASDLEHQQSVRDRKDKTYPVPSESPKGVDWRSKGKKIARSFAQDLTTKKTPGSTERVHKTSSDYAGTLVPSYRWLSTYQWKSTLWRDAVAGLTIGLMVVPQGMSYAKLAGLPVQYGLYAAFAPLYIYAVFGSSRHLSVGPVAITSLLLGDGLSAVMAGRGISDDDDGYESVYVQLAIQTSFLVGIIYLAMTIFRLGFITSFLSHSVISGFTSGAAIVSFSLSCMRTIRGHALTILSNVRSNFPRVVPSRLLP